MKKQKIYSLILAVSFTATMLGGCGNTSNSTTSNSVESISDTKSYNEVTINNDLPSGKSDEVFLWLLKSSNLKWFYNRNASCIRLRRFYSWIFLSR